MTDNMYPSTKNPSASGNDRVENTVEITVGQWYWVLGDEEEWLGCVMKVGSNFVEVDAPSSPKGRHSSVRVHADEFHTALRLEPNAAAVINQNIKHHQDEVSECMAEIQRITTRLGVDGTPALMHKSGESDSTGLAVLSGNEDITGYEKALIRAKEDELPVLFKKIEEANKSLVKWMTANTLPLKAVTNSMKGTVGQIEDRLFNVSLYAGLTESVAQIAAGTPAKMADKLHVLQRRLYMDEECLLSYTTGGMEFKDIHKYDNWLCQPENRDRILPFPRCMVAMQVRRKEKERDNVSSMLDAWINMNRAIADKTTFLYIRNGEQVYRLNCDLDFDEMLFPDATMFDPSEPKMVKMFAGRVDQMMGLSEYESRLQEHISNTEKYDQWYIDNPLEEWAKVNRPNDKDPSFHWETSNPYSHRGSSFSPRQWKPFDSSNVYYDECVEVIASRMKKYNRVALIIQGLFDRSEVLHPHPPVKTWTADGFRAAIELVYDGSGVLTYGDAPDFEEYRQRCNESLAEGSVTVGQDLAWQKKEAVKENDRILNNWRDRSGTRYTTFTPYGNPGPGYLARVARWQPRARKATYLWSRERLRNDGFQEEYIKASITVPAAKLFNVSAYTPGDYKQFFQDPRTRADYLKWAPMLLAAEEYWAGNMKVQEPTE